MARLTDETDETRHTLPRLMRIAEVAHELRRSERTIRSWMASGRLRAVRPCGGKPMIARAELERVLREGTR